MKVRLIDDEVKLVPYYPNYATALEWYQDLELCMAQLLEAQAGCEESVLFVSNDNAGARALYEKCGYAFLRAHGYGSYMRKQL